MSYLICLLKKKSYSFDHLNTKYWRNLAFYFYSILLAEFDVWFYTEYEFVFSTGIYLLITMNILLTTWMTKCQRLYGISHINKPKHFCFSKQKKITEFLPNLPNPWNSWEHIWLSILYFLLMFKKNKKFKLTQINNSFILIFFYFMVYLVLVS